jgi:hypothetical protein
MSEQPEVVMLMRAAVIEALTFGPEVTESVLQHLATVQYRGDDHAYIEEASEAIASATRKAVQPLIDRLKAETAANIARADLLEAQMKRFQQDFEAFRRMATPKTIQ